MHFNIRLVSSRYQLARWHTLFWREGKKTQNFYQEFLHRRLAVLHLWNSIKAADVTNICKFHSYKCYFLIIMCCTYIDVQHSFMYIHIVCDPVRIITLVIYFHVRYRKYMCLRRDCIWKYTTFYLLEYSLQEMGSDFPGLFFRMDTFDFFL